MLYNGTQGGQWANRSGWLGSNTPCAWYGVTCLPDYRVDGDNDIDIVDIQRVAGATWAP